MHSQLIMSNHLSALSTEDQRHALLILKWLRSLETILLESRRIYVVLRQQCGVILRHLWVKALQVVFASWYAKKKKKKKDIGKANNWIPRTRDALVSSSKETISCTGAAMRVITQNVFDGLALTSELSWRSRSRIDGWHRTEKEITTRFPFMSLM